jgi:hypothetical protein
MGTNSGTQGCTEMHDFPRNPRKSGTEILT